MKNAIVNLQKESQLLHLLWKKQHELLSIYEELRQCKTRIVASPDICKNSIETCKYDLATFQKNYRFDYFFDVILGKYLQHFRFLIRQLDLSRISPRSRVISAWILSILLLSFFLVVTSFVPFAFLTIQNSTSIPFVQCANGNIPKMM